MLSGFQARDVQSMLANIAGDNMPIQLNKSLRAASQREALVKDLSAAPSECDPETWIVE